MWTSQTLTGGRTQKERMFGAEGITGSYHMKPSRAVQPKGLIPQPFPRIWLRTASRFTEGHQSWCCSIRLWGSGIRLWRQKSPGLGSSSVSILTRSTLKWRKADCCNCREHQFSRDFNFGFQPLGRTNPSHVFVLRQNAEPKGLGGFCSKDRYTIVKTNALYTSNCRVVSRVHN